MIFISGLPTERTDEATAQECAPSVPIRLTNGLSRAVAVKPPLEALPGGLARWSPRQVDLRLASPAGGALSSNGLGKVPAVRTARMPGWASRASLGRQDLESRRAYAGRSDQAEGAKWPPPSRRTAYEGFQWSHASIMDNVTRRIPEVSRLVQVGIRDFCEQEFEAIGNSGGRIRTLFDRDWSAARFDGKPLRELVRAHLAHLPEKVFVSFDIDALEPALCPNTGTPVPGGLTWREANLWLDELAASGRTVVGLDLNEVSPGPAPGVEDAWDAIVGARLLYRMIATALATR